MVDSLQITKAAKRVIQLLKPKIKKHIYFAKLRINRLNGAPISLEEKKLIKLKDFLLHGKRLNSE